MAYLNLMIKGTSLIFRQLTHEPGMASQLEVSKIKMASKHTETFTTFKRKHCIADSSLQTSRCDSGKKICSSCDYYNYVNRLGTCASNNTKWNTVELIQCVLASIDGSRKSSRFNERRGSESELLHSVSLAIGIYGRESTYVAWDIGLVIAWS